ncbi:MAG: MMPL family transporter [Gemmataceae bacterium]
MSNEQHRSDELSWVQRGLLGLVGVSQRFPKTVLVLVFLGIGLSVYLALTQLTFLTQRNDLVSPKRDHLQRWRQYVAEFGDDDDMVVVVRGNDAPDMKQALEELAQKLHEHSDLFDRVFYKVDLRDLRKRALVYMPTEEIQKINRELDEMNVILVPCFLNAGNPRFGWESITLSNLMWEVNHSRLYVCKQNGGVKEREAKFFAQVAQIFDSATETLKDQKNYKNPWQGVLPGPRNRIEGDGANRSQGYQQDLLGQPQYFTSEDGSLAFLLVRPATKDLSSFALVQKNVEVLRGFLAELRQKYPSLEFGLTGLPVMENDEIEASQMDTWHASWMALAGVSILYLLVYRCVRYPVLTISTLLVGMVWVLGWLTATIGHLNMLSATFGVMLIGMGDYGVLFVTRYEQERARGVDVTQALHNTTCQVGPSILTAAITTAVAFFTAMFIDFRAIAELGWIAGSGVVMCALSCFTYLPAMIRLVDRKPVVTTPATLPISTMTGGTIERGFLPGVTRRPWIVIASACLVVVVCGYFAFSVKYDHNLLHMQAKGLDSVKWERILIDKTSGASWHAVIFTNTREEAIDLKKRYERLDGVSKVVEVASLIPQDQGLKLNLMENIYSRLQRLPTPGEIKHNPPKLEYLDMSLTELIERLGPWAKKDANTKQLRESLIRFQKQLGETPEIHTLANLNVFENNLTTDLCRDLHQLKDVSRPEAITVASLPKSLRERYVGESGKYLLRIFGKGSLWEFGELEKFANSIKEVHPDATGKPFSTLTGLKLVRDGFKWAGIYALIAMIIVLLVDFRNASHAGLALIPLVIGIVVSLGIMGLFGLPLNPANMIAIPLILGVGADNGIHIVHDYLTRQRQKRYTLSFSTGRGIMVAALTTIIGFGTLMISHHRGLASLGLLLTIGVSCCMLTALVFLPALLRILTRERSGSNEATGPKVFSSRAA